MYFANKKADLVTYFLSVRGRLRILAQGWAFYML
jgi:hypothetical protein